jgi:hypothetical protein
MASRKGWSSSRSITSCSVMPVSLAISAGVRVGRSRSPPSVGLRAPWRARRNHRRRLTPANRRSHRSGSSPPRSCWDRWRSSVRYDDQYPVIVFTATSVALGGAVEVALGALARGRPQAHFIAPSVWSCSLRSGASPLVHGADRVDEPWIETTAGPVLWRRPPSSTRRRPSHGRPPPGRRTACGRCHPVRSRAGAELAQALGLGLHGA